MSDTQKNYLVWLFKVIGFGFTGPFSIIMLNLITTGVFPGFIFLILSLIVLTLGVTLLYIAYSALGRF
jgi:hypothetical protein